MEILRKAKESYLSNMSSQEPQAERQAAQASTYKAPKSRNAKAPAAQAAEPIVKSEPITQQQEQAAKPAKAKRPLNDWQAYVKEHGKGGQKSLKQLSTEYKASKTSKA